MVRILLVGLVVLVFSACTKKATPGTQHSAELRNYSEDLAYLLPKYDAGKVESVGEVEEKQDPVQWIEIEDDNQLVDGKLAKIVENNKKIAEGAGFRIQVFSGNNRSDYENAKSFLLRNFSKLEIYESYSQPTYRIKVGDFVSYQDAEKQAALLKQRFGNPRVISDKINIKKALTNK